MDRAEKKKKILLIEDYEAIARAYKEGLERAGFIVDRIINGEKALAKIKSFKPDLILLDLIMPDVNGFETLKLIKEKIEATHTPVVIVSNLYEGHYRKQALSLGAVEFLVKTDYTITQLVAAINKIMNKNERSIKQ